MSPTELARGTLDKVVEWLGRRESGTVVSVSMLAVVCYGIFYAAPVLIEQHKQVISLIQAHDSKERDNTREAFSKIFEAERSNHLEMTKRLTDSFVEIVESMRQERLVLVDQIKQKGSP